MAVKKIPDFRRAGAQRLAAARYLLESEDANLYRDAMYLAGYVVECSLKALILRRTARGQQQPMFERISRGKRSHDFDWLVVILTELGCVVPPGVADQLWRTLDWSPDWRYVAGALERDETTGFFEAVVQIRDWAERS